MLKITMIGHLGRDPELRYTPQGDPICSFTMASTDRKKDRATGENVETTTWARITFFGKQAETASQWLVKGRQVYIEGRGRLETWTDRDGKERTNLEIIGTEMQFIGPRDANGGGGQGGGRGAQSNSPRAAARERAKSAAPAGGGLTLGEDDGSGSGDDIPF